MTHALALRRSVGALLALGALGSLLIAGTPAVSAAPATVFGPPHELSKTTLTDFSIDGPALWTAPSGAIRAELGWVGGGNDTAHHINLMTSADGLHWGNKITLAETSATRPGLTRYSANTNDNVVVAWTGRDSNHSLNVLVGNPPLGFTKLTLRNDNSFTSPSVAMLKGDVYLVWAGTDPGQTLNVAQIIPRGGLSVGAHTTLWGWRSIARPSVVYDPNSQRLVMSWTSNDQRIHFATSTDGIHWTQATSSPLAEWSDVGPMMFSAAANNMPRYFVTWRGTNSAHSVNVQYTESFPRWPSDGSKGILAESSFGGPEIGYVGVYRQVIVAWAGMDALHHLNVAVVGM
jgi:hypothetical protein